MKTQDKKTSKTKTEHECKCDALLREKDAIIARQCERLREMAARGESADEVARLLREVRAVDKKTIDELSEQVQWLNGLTGHYDREVERLRKCLKDTERLRDDLRVMKAYRDAMSKALGDEGYQIAYSNNGQTLTIDKRDPRQADAVVASTAGRLRVFLGSVCHRWH